MTYHIGERSLATILAALRFLEQTPPDVMKRDIPDIYDIATDGGRFQPMTAAEIDQLCIQLNSK